MMRSETVSLRDLRPLVLREQRSFHCENNEQRTKNKDFELRIKSPLGEKVLGPAS